MVAVVGRQPRPRHWYRGSLQCWVGGGVAEVATAGAQLRQPLWENSLNSHQEPFFLKNKILHFCGSVSVLVVCLVCFCFCFRCSC